MNPADKSVPPTKRLDDLVTSVRSLIQSGMRGATLNIDGGVDYSLFEVNGSLSTSHLEQFAQLVLLDSS